MTPDRPHLLTRPATPGYPAQHRILHAPTEAAALTRAGPGWEPATTGLCKVCH